MDRTHPLELWLDKRGESVVDFAERIGFSFVAVYALMRGARKKPTARFLEAIQTGTGGAVSIMDMLAWQRRNVRQESA